MVQHRPDHQQRGHHAAWHLQPLRGLHRLRRLTPPLAREIAAHRRSPARAAIRRTAHRESRRDRDPGHRRNPDRRTDPDAILRYYYAELASRYYRRPATGADIAAARAEEPDDGLEPPRGSFLALHRDSVPCGCVGVRAPEPGIAELKRLYVRPEARGLGAGGRLVVAAQSRARELGYRAIRLDTRHDLVEARGLYAKRGSAEIPAYNRGTYAEYWFEKPSAEVTARAQVCALRARG
ncbi:GNAT family N-acetyltransferase [Saccharopolyspora griseoalba]|uniref:GNAT family N-acetyltransferase n=1 Tax=Saccharopolyspora griseoalba TaxID=1431848 RepID=A0ABW2LN55_9PSEU